MFFNNMVPDIAVCGDQVFALEGSRLVHGQVIHMYRPVCRVPGIRDMASSRTQNTWNQLPQQDDQTMMSDPCWFQGQNTQQSDVFVVCQISDLPSLFVQETGLS